MSRKTELTKMKPITATTPTVSGISFASEPKAHYLLVSTRDEGPAEIRSFRIVDAVVTEEPVQVVNASVDPMAVQSYMFGQSPSSVDYECRA